MILITGGTGFIGSHVAERLVTDGTVVRCLVRSAAGLRGLPQANIELAYGDLVSGDGLTAALRGVSTVIHLAGVTKARRTADYQAGNAIATANLVAAANGLARFVHISSLAAAGPSGNAPLTEDSPPCPVSHYGRSKLAGEQAVQNSPLWHRSIIIRPPVVFGPRDTDVFQVIRAAAQGWILQIGRAVRQFSWIYVTDLVDALVKAAGASPFTGGRIYHIAHPSPVSWEEFGRAAARILARSARILAVPETAAYALGACAELWNHWSRKPGILSRDKVVDACCSGWVCDTGRACRELGFRANIGLEDGLRRAIAWYKEAGWLKC